MAADMNMDVVRVLILIISLLSICLLLSIVGLVYLYYQFKKDYRYARELCSAVAHLNICNIPAPLEGYKSPIRAQLAELHHSLYLLTRYMPENISMQARGQSQSPQIETSNSYNIGLNTLKEPIGSGSNNELVQSVRSINTSLSPRSIATPGVLGSRGSINGVTTPSSSLLKSNSRFGLKISSGSLATVLKNLSTWQQKRLVVLKISVVIHGVYDSSNASNIQTLQQHYQQLGSIVVASIKHHHGTLDRFSNGRFVAVWGIVTSTEAAVQACLAAFELRTALQAHTWTLPMTYYLGIAAGDAVTGSLDTASQSAIITIGWPGVIAQSLAKPQRTSWLSSAVLVDQHIHEKAQYRFNLRPVDVILPPELKKMMCCLCRMHPGEVIYELESERDLKTAGEWMYEIEYMQGPTAIPDNERFPTSNPKDKPFHLAGLGKYREALQCAETLLQQDPQHTPLRALANKLQEYVQSQDVP